MIYAILGTIVLIIGSPIIAILDIIQNHNRKNY